MVAYIKPLPQWEEHEKPSMPGSASMPWHPPLIRVAYGCVALLVGLTGGLGNALVSANLPTIQGQLGLTPSQGAWLTAAYVMVNVTTNLIVFKFRQQFGLRLFAELGLGLYALLTLLHLLAGGFGMAVIVRAASGFAAAAASTLATLYMLQAFPRKYTGRALVLGVGISQLATPLAWVLSPGLLQAAEWHNLYLFEAGLALCAFAAVVSLKLPPGIQIRTFERLDFLTFALMAPAVAMLVAVLAQGYILWWFNTPWLAYCLIGAIILLTIAVWIEHYRSNPLIQTRWLASGPTVRFIFGAILIRFLTTEQNFGAVGLMRNLGMGPDQMQSLFVFVLVGVVCGIAASAITFGPKTMIPQILVSIVLLGAAGFLDHQRTSLDRPHDFYVSQFILAIGVGMFMGPLILIGIRQALKNGVDHIISFIVMLSITQSVGSLAGSAFMSTYEAHREHVYSMQFVSQVDPADSVVAQRLRLQQQVYATRMTDPVLRAAQGTAQLAQVVRREATVRAFNDVFFLNGLLAVLFLLWSLFQTVRTRMANRKAVQA